MYRYLDITIESLGCNKYCNDEDISYCMMQNIYKWHSIRATPVLGNLYQEIEILPLKCGKWKLGGNKLWKVEIRG